MQFQLMLTFFGLVLVAMIFWIWMFVECLNVTPADKRLGWILLFILTGFFGAMLYYIRRPPKDVYIEYRPETPNEFIVAEYNRGKPITFE